MKILEINSVPYGSTCNIMTEIYSLAVQDGLNIRTATGYSTHPNKNLPKNHIAIGSVGSKLLHILLAKITGYNGCFSAFSTIKLLRYIKAENIDLLHFHNLHGWYINLPILFGFVKKNNIPVVWTLHDCWSFTGQCPHFTMEKCEKWRDGCYKCPQYHLYPSSYVDKTKTMWHLKKKWFTGVKDLTIVTPSRWLGNLVKESFLKEYPVKVINNGINLTIFKPTQSEFRKKYQLEKKHIVLGVSFGWSEKKGLDVFEELSRRLGDNYQMVLVGTNDETDKRLPKNIISIHTTQNQTELAEIYSAADVFVQPTREENYPTVNMEALACGTPIVTFNTGGCAEIHNDTCGVTVECDDIEAVSDEIRQICETNKFSQECCVERAVNFDSHKRMNEYIKLYRSKEK